MNKNQLKKYYKGCLAVGEGKKRINDEKTDRDAIVFFVQEKKEIKNLTEDQIIPKEIEGKETDVQVLKEIPEVIDLTQPSNRQTSVRPITGGISIGCAFSTAGTLGIVCYYDGEPAIISNAHVIAPHWAGAELGHPVIQPGWVDGPFEQVADLVKFGEISFDKPNKVDYGIGPIRNGIEFEPMKIIGIGEINPEVRRVTSSDVMLSTGRTSGPAEEDVLAVNTDAYVRIAGVVTEWEDQIFFKNNNSFVRAGDSGSLIIFKNDLAIGGLVYAGSSEVGVANQMVNVQEDAPLLSFKPEEETEQKMYAAYGRSLYIKPQRKIEPTKVNLNVRSKPEIDDSTYLETLPKGTPVEILEYYGFRGGYEWVKIKKVE